MNVKIYVEGGGDSKESHIRCRRGFSKLIEKAGFAGRMPGIVACGGRNVAFDHFKTAIKPDTPADFPLLLVDSEDPVPDGATAWGYLQARDDWTRPDNANDDQAQLMVACMETWIMADRVALRIVFGNGLQVSALLPETNLEQYDRHRVQQALENTTRNCGTKKAYQKGQRSFQALEAVNPNTIEQHLPYFKRFIVTLEKYLNRKKPLP